MGLTTKEIGSSSFNDMISSVDRRSEYVENRAGANVTLNNFLTPYTLDNKSSILNAPCGYSNGVYASLRPVQTFGPELIDLTQGAAEQPSQWSNITTNSVNFLTGAAGTRYFNVNSTQSTLISGKKYSLILEISNYSGTDTLGLSTQGNVSINARLDANGTYKEVFVSDGESLRIFGRATNSATITLSVKEVTDADFDFTRGSSATRVNEKGLIEDVQILSSNLVQNGDFEQIGSELVTNGNFDTDSDWFKTQATISNSKLTISTSDGSYAAVRQFNALVIGKTYLFTIDVDSVSSGSIAVGNSSLNINSSGIYSGYYVSNSTTAEIKRNTFGSATDAVINSISIKEVGQNWTFGTGWSISDGKANCDGTQTGNTSLTQFGAFSTLANKSIKISFTVSNYSAGSVRFISGNGALAGAFVSANGVVTLYFNVGANSGTSFNIQGNADFIGSIDNVSVIEITDDTDIPRIDYTSGTGALLLEPQSTNLITYSEDFSDSSWNLGTNAVLTYETNITAPDGSLGVYRLTLPAQSSTFLNFQTGAGTTNYTGSIYAKSASVNDEGFNLFYGGLVSSRFITNNDWLRYDYNDNGNQFAIVNDGDTFVTDIYIWGAQLEQKSYATSYIPTSGSTVTRLADVADNSGNADLINSTEGVLYAEISALEDLGTTRRYISLSDGSTNNDMRLYYNNAIGEIVALSKVGGVTQFVMSDNGYDLTETHKIAVKYKVNNFSLWIDGVEVDTASSGAVNATNTFNELAFNGNGIPFFGNVKCVAVFKEALTDAELAQITSATQQEVFYEMRDRMNIKNYDYYEFGDYTTRLKKLF